MKALEHIIALAKAEHPELYAIYEIEQHEEKFGCHFDEETAREAVGKMWAEVDGKRIQGQHWTIEQTNNVMTENRVRAEQWDFYYVMHFLYYLSNGHEDVYPMVYGLFYSEGMLGKVQNRPWKIYKAMM